MKEKMAIISMIALLCMISLVSAVGNLNFYINEEGFQGDTSNIDFMWPRQGIIDYNWIDDNTLFIETYITTFCIGATITGGDYEINGDNLILKYKIVTGDVVTSCVSQRAMIYEISSIERKDYDISIQEICEEGYEWDKEQYFCNKINEKKEIIKCAAGTKLATQLDDETKNYYIGVPGFKSVYKFIVYSHIEAEDNWVSFSVNGKYGDTKNTIEPFGTHLFVGESITIDGLKITIKELGYDSDNKEYVTFCYGLEEVLEENIKEEIIVEHSLLFYFYSELCPHCNGMGEELEKVSQVLDVGLLKIDVKKEEDIVRKYKIRAVPSLVFIKDDGTYIIKEGKTDYLSIIEWIENSGDVVSEEPVNIEEVPTKEEIIDIPVEEVEEVTYFCQGCLLDQKCYPFGYRKEGRYCSDEGKFVAQLESDNVCENNFECESNVCVSGKCISSSLLEKIINWFKKLFGH